MLLDSLKADQGIGREPVLDGIMLPLKKQVHILEVLLDSSLSLDAQVSAAARSAFAQLKLVHQLCPFLENSDLTTVIHALVTSRLNYCTVVPRLENIPT